jgi:hypothetical protein
VVPGGNPDGEEGRGVDGSVSQRIYPSYHGCLPGVTASCLSLSPGLASDPAMLSKVIRRLVTIAVNQAGFISKDTIPGHNLNIILVQEVLS